MEPADTAGDVRSSLGDAAGADSSTAAEWFEGDVLTRFAPDDQVRAGLALLSGTVGAALLGTIGVAGTGPDAIGIGPTTSPGRVVGPDDDGRVVVNARYRAEHPALLTPSLAHALLWSGPGAGEAEEVLLHGLVATLHVQSIARHPGLAHLGTELARRQNSLAITLLNSRRPGDPVVRLRASDGPGTIPGGAPGMQTPDFASIPFAGGPDPFRERPLVLDDVLDEVAPVSSTASRSSRYDDGLVDAFALEAGWGPTVLVASVALGMIDPAEAAEAAAGHDIAGLDAARACWSHEKA